MRIGILTFHCAINYGAVLQTYALQEYLKGLGHDVYVLDYRPSYLLNPYKTFIWKWLADKSLVENVKSLLRCLLITPIKIKRKLYFRKFTIKYLKLYSFYPERIDFDAIVLGSDQIWNPQITEGFDPVYFGDFKLPNKCKVISYAASVGSIKNIIGLEDKFKMLLKHIDCISVREKSLADYVDTFAWGKLVSVVIDPVLLVGKNIFTSMNLKRKHNKPYLLVFRLSHHSYGEMLVLANQIASQKGLDVIDLVSSSEVLRNKKMRMSETVEGFISLFMYADYVLTSSFHGTIFSLIFEKDFNTIISEDWTSERMISLLSLLGLEDRLLKRGMPSTKVSSINYVEVNRRIELLRLNSQLSLHKFLS